MVGRMLGAVTKFWKVPVGVWGDLLFRILEVCSVVFWADATFYRMEQRFLVFSESQNDIDAVDPASTARPGTFSHVIVVYYPMSGIVHYSKGIHWQMHPSPWKHFLWILSGKKMATTCYKAVGLLFKDVGSVFSKDHFNELFTHKET